MSSIHRSALLIKFVRATRWANFNRFSFSITNTQLSQCRDLMDFFYIYPHFFIFLWLGNSIFSQLSHPITNDISTYLLTQVDKTTARQSIPPCTLLRYDTGEFATEILIWTYVLSTVHTTVIEFRNFSLLKKKLSSGRKLNVHT